MRYAITLTALFFASFLSAQITGELNENFVLGAQYGATTTLTDSTYQIDCTHLFSQLNNTYLPTDIQVGDITVDPNKRRFRVKVVVSSTFLTSTLQVVRLQDTNLPPSGVGFIYRPMGENDFMPREVASLISPALEAMVDNHNANVAASLVGTVADTRVDSLIALTGVPANSTTIGAMPFPGLNIDNTTIKSALTLLAVDAWATDGDKSNSNEGRLTLFPTYSGGDVDRVALRSSTTGTKDIIFVPGTGINFEVSNVSSAQDSLVISSDGSIPSLADSMQVVRDSLLAIRSNIPNACSYTFVNPAPFVNTHAIDSLCDVTMVYVNATVSVTDPRYINIPLPSSANEGSQLFVYLKDRFTPFGFIEIKATGSTVFGTPAFVSDIEFFPAGEPAAFIKVYHNQRKHFVSQNVDGVYLWVEIGTTVTVTSGATFPSIPKYGDVHRVNNFDEHYMWTGTWTRIDDGGVIEIIAGLNTTVDNTDPQYPIIRVPSLDDADANPTNEGALSVGAGGTNDADIVSNTSGSTPIKLQGAGNTTITENPGTGVITISSTGGGGGGGSGVTGTGTVGTIPVFTGTGTIGDGLLKQSGANLYTSTLYNSTHGLQLAGALTLRDGNFTSTEAITAALDIRNQSITARSGFTDRLYGINVQGTYTFNTLNQVFRGISVDIASNATPSQAVQPMYVRVDATGLTESQFANAVSGGSNGAIWSAGSLVGTERVWVRSPSGGFQGSRTPGFGASTATYGHNMEPQSYGWLFRLNSSGSNPAAVNGSLFFSGNGVHIGSRGSTPPFTYPLDFESTGAIRIPRGTTAQRPVGASSIWRYSSTTGAYEGHNGTSFGRLYLSSDVTPTNGQIKIFNSAIGMDVYTTPTTTEVVTIQGQDRNDAVATGSDYARWYIPSEYDGATITKIAYFTDDPNGGTVLVQLTNGTTGFSAATVPVGGYVEISASRAVTYTAGAYIKLDVNSFTGTPSGLGFRLFITR